MTQCLEHTFKYSTDVNWMLIELTYWHCFLPSICSGIHFFIPCHEILGNIYINQLLSPTAMIINYNVVLQNYNWELLNAFSLSFSPNLIQLNNHPIWEKKNQDSWQGLVIWYSSNVSDKKGSPGYLNNIDKSLRITVD